MYLPDEFNGVKPLMAKIRNARGGMTDLVIQDLSAAGCMIDPRGVGLCVDDRVLVKLEGLEFIPACVLWIEDNKAGIAFERAIHETVFEHLSSRLLQRRAA